MFMSRHFGCGREKIACSDLHSKDAKGRKGSQTVLLDELLSRIDSKERMVISTTHRHEASASFCRFLEWRQRPAVRRTISQRYPKKPAPECVL